MHFRNFDPTRQICPKFGPDPTRGSTRPVSIPGNVLCDGSGLLKLTSEWQ